MTRINSNLNPEYLLDQVLMAEYRELPMVFGSLNRSLKSVNHNTSVLIRKIPKQFTLNTGHVLFFYNKLKFLMGRYDRLKEELLGRGYNLDSERDMYFLEDFPEELHGDYVMQVRDKEIIVERLILRYNKQPDWYRYHKQPIDAKTFNFLLENS